MIFSKDKLQAAHLRNLRGILQRALILPKQRLHFRLVPEIEILRLVAHPVLVIRGPASLDTQQHIMRLRILLTEIVGVVGADHRQACLLVDPQKALVHNSLIADAMILKFQIKMFRSEDPAEF